MNAGVAVERMEQRASTIVGRAKALKVHDQRSYELAAAHLLAIATLRREIEAHHAPVKKAAHAAWQQAIAAERRLLDPVIEAERIFKASIAEYEAEERRLEKEKQAKAQTEALREAEEARERELEQAEAEGADAEEIASMINEPLTVMPARVEPVFRPVKGVSTFVNWKAEVISLEALVKAVAASKANIGLVMANETAINQLARATRGTLTIPGVRFFSEPVVRAGRR
jgi:hypothetical protein